MTLTASAPSTPAGRRSSVIDGDIHPQATARDIASRLEEPWRARFERFGVRGAAPPMVYPRVRNGGVRLDAFPEEGIPGGDLPLLRDQLLDAYGIDIGILIPLQSHTYGAEQPEYAAALCTALNEWIAEDWLDEEPRLRGSLCIPHESPDLAVREIEHYAPDPRFVQVLFPTGTHLSIADPKYVPIFEAAVRANRPIAIHLGGAEAHRGDGWPSFYLEQHAWYGNLMAMALTTLVCSGIFERLPDLRVVLVEGGISWVSPLIWSLDEAWPLMRDDLPRLGRKPSDVVREHFWFTTQPIEEPGDPEHLATTLRHSNMLDRIVFSSDYPHWDFDAPDRALRHIPKDLRIPIMYANAQRLYGFESAGACR